MGRSKFEIKTIEQKALEDDWETVGPGVEVNQCTARWYEVKITEDDDPKRKSGKRLAISISKNEEYVVQFIFMLPTIQSSASRRLLPSDLAFGSSGVAPG